jgi:hypothetical protein
VVPNTARRVREKRPLEKNLKRINEILKEAESMRKDYKSKHC